MLYRQIQRNISREIYREKQRDVWQHHLYCNHIAVYEAFRLHGCRDMILQTSVDITETHRFNILCIHIHCIYIYDI